MLPRVAQWIRRLQELHARLGQHENRLADLRNAGGADLGGPLVNAWTGDWAEVRKILWEFASRGILLKDIDRGLVDFPAIREGREVPCAASRKIRQVKQIIVACHPLERTPGRCCAADVCANPRNSGPAIDRARERRERLGNCH